jgi:hypothetical protein
LPGFFSSVQPRILNTSLIGPLLLNIVLKGADVLGVGTGAGTKIVCSTTDPITLTTTLTTTTGTPAVTTAATTSSFTLSDDNVGSKPFETLYINETGGRPAPSNTTGGSFTWDQCIALIDVLNMPPEYSQFNQLVLSSGNSFQMPFEHYTVLQKSMQTFKNTEIDFNDDMRFSISTMCLNQIIAWICPDQSVQHRHYDEVTMRSSRYNRMLPGSFQFTVSGSLYPSFPCRRKFSWPIFMSSICKLHDAQHEFHPGLISYENWTDKLGVMCYRFNVPEQDGRSWYSGLNTQNVAIQMFLNTTKLDNTEYGTATGKTHPKAGAEDMNGSQYVAMMTTRVISIGANKATSLIV